MGSICIEKDLREQVEEKLKKDNVNYQISGKGNSVQLTVDKTDQAKCSEIIQGVRNEMYKKQPDKTSQKEQDVVPENTNMKDKSYQNEIQTYARERGFDPEKIKELVDKTVPDNQNNYHFNHEEVKACMDGKQNTKETAALVNDAETFLKELCEKYAVNQKQEKTAENKSEKEDTNDKEENEQDKNKKKKDEDALIRNDRETHMRNHENGRKKTLKESEKKEAKEAFDKEVGQSAKNADFILIHKGREADRANTMKGPERTR